MSELKTNVTDNDLQEITSPNVLYIMRTIKAIQKRMKDPDNIGLEYIRLYEKLCNEFTEFCDKYTSIFTKVLRGEKLGTVASVLYYRDKVERGLMTEEELSEMLAKKYLPEHLKKESDDKIKEIKEKERL